MANDNNFIGRQIGNYRIVEEIASGSFGGVYKSVHIHLPKRIVAIKVLHRTYLGAQQERNNFLREAQLLEILKHPYILPIYDVGIEDGIPYFVVEYAPNGSLRDHLHEHFPHPMPVDEALMILAQIGQALSHAHQQNIIHRDLKPENILFNARGDALLADFGIAVLLSTPRTTPVNIIGSPLYMAPEQFDGMISKRSDQYALACIAYEMVTGRNPFLAPDAVSMALKHKTEKPIAPTQFNTSLPLPVEQVILKALSKDRSNRFISISTFLSALHITTKQDLEDQETVDEAKDFAVKPTNDEQPIRLDSNNTNNDPNNLFIRYHKTDRNWAEWIAWQLEEAGYTAILPAWDFRPGSDFEMEIKKADAKATNTIVVLSPAYLNSYSRHNARDTTFEEIRLGEQKRLLPVQVKECGHKLTKLIGATVYIDLVGLDEPTARKTLLAGVRYERGKPPTQPLYPGNKVQSSRKKQPFFPSSQADFGLALTQQLMPQIETAFTKDDWPDVIRKTNFLIKQTLVTVSPDIYHMQGLALLKEGHIQLALESLEDALALAIDPKQRLTLFDDYSKVLASLGEWNEVLLITQEALRLAPNEPNWIAFQQQAQTQVSAFRKLTMSKSISDHQSVHNIEIFVSYSHKDKELLGELEKYLSNLKRQHSITGWHDGEIEAGKDWAEEINVHLSKAQVILLLVSQDFIASDYCYNIEMKQALERHQVGHARVIPIILRPAHWEVTSFGGLQALPTGAKAITTWTNRDEAFLNVARGIQKAVDRLTRNV